MKTRVNIVEPKTTITIELFEPVDDLPWTRRPKITFTGELVSQRSLAEVHFYMVKALRAHKADLARDHKAELKRGSEK